MGNHTGREYFCLNLFWQSLLKNTSLLKIAQEGLCLVKQFLYMKVERGWRVETLES